MEILEEGRFFLTQAQSLTYIYDLTYPDITINHCTTVNPADMFPLEHEGQLHVCLADSLTFTRLRPDLESTPNPDADVDYFVDGSCFKDHLINHAGYSVVRKDKDNFVSILSQHCTQPCSAQLAEFKPLTTACQLAKG